MAQKRRRKRKLSDVKAAYLKRGDIYNRRGELDKAKAAFLKVLAIDADSPTVHSSIALIYMRQGMFEEADKYITDALLLDPSCESTYQVLELFEKEQKKQEEENK